MVILYQSEHLRIQENPGFHSCRMMEILIPSCLGQSKRFPKQLAVTLKIAKECVFETNGQ